MGDVRFRKTYYQNKTTGEYEYLLDRLLEIDSHERLTEDAEAKMLQEVVEAPYHKAGEETSLQSSISKQTVKNKIHKLEFPKYNVERDKKVVDYLYIDADEDHVHLQFRETKGDLEVDGNNRKEVFALPEDSGIKYYHPQFSVPEIPHHTYMPRTDGLGYSIEHYSTGEDYEMELQEYVEELYEGTKNEYHFEIGTLRPNETLWLDKAILLKPVEGKIEISYSIKSNNTTGDNEGLLTYIEPT